MNVTDHRRNVDRTKDRQRLSSLNYHEIIPDNSKPFPPGLPNLGNTCYMNAALQCLLTVKPLVEWLLEPNSSSAEQNATEVPLLKPVLSKLVASVFYQDCSVDLREFRRVIGKLKKSFQEPRQQDAQEFLQFLLSQLHEESVSGSQPSASSKIQEIFEGTLKSKISCSLCASKRSHKSKHEENKCNSEVFLFLSVPIPVSQDEIDAATMDGIHYNVCDLNVVFNEIAETTPPRCYRRLLRLSPSTSIESVYAKVQSFTPIQGYEHSTKNREPLLLIQVTSTGFGSWFLDKSGCARDLTDGLNVEDNFYDLDSVTTRSAVKRSLLEGDAVYIVRLNTAAATPTPHVGNGVGVSGESGVTSTMKTTFISTESPLSQIDSEVSGLYTKSTREPASLLEQPQDTRDANVTDEAKQSDSIQLLMVHVEEGMGQSKMAHGSTIKEDEVNAERASAFRRFSPPISVIVPKDISFEQLRYLAVQSLSRFCGRSPKPSLTYKCFPSVTFWAVDALPGEQEIDSRLEYALLHSAVDESFFPLPDWLTKACSCECPRLLRLLVVWPRAPRDCLAELKVEVDESLAQPHQQPTAAYLRNVTVSEKSKSMSSPSLPMSSTARNIEYCLKEFIKPTKVQQDPDSSECLNCGKRTESMWLAMELEKPPAYLLLQLNRFLYCPRLFSGSSPHGLHVGGGDGFHKIHSFVDYPIDGLDLSFMMEQPIKRSRSRSLGDSCQPVYDLVAVCNHKGSLQMGHITAYCRNLFTKQWWHYNDERVQKVSSEQVVQSYAYLLVYKRRGADNDDDCTTIVGRIKDLLAGRASKEDLVESTSSSIPPAVPKRSNVRVVPNLEGAQTETQITEL